MAETRAGLPQALIDLLSGQDLPARRRDAFLLAAGDADGQVRTALLSAGEVLATGADEVRLALYAHSRTTAAVEASGRALLVAVADHTLYKVQLRPELGDAGQAPEGERGFIAAVDAVESDTVAYASVTHNLGFQAHDEQALLASWRTKTAWLRQLRQEAP